MRGRGVIGGRRRGGGVCFSRMGDKGGGALDEGGGELL
jgi:hypothetical protein